MIGLFCFVLAVLASPFESKFAADEFHLADIVPEPQDNGAAPGPPANRWSVRVGLRKSWPVRYAAFADQAATPSKKRKTLPREQIFRQHRPI